MSAPDGARHTTGAFTSCSTLGPAFKSPHNGLGQVTINHASSSATSSSRPIQDRKWSISIDSIEIFSVPATWSPSQPHIGKIADSVAVGLVGIAENRNVDEMGGRPI